jgi:hypothetical protein
MADVQRMLNEDIPDYMEDLGEEDLDSKSDRSLILAGLSASRAFPFCVEELAACL